MTTDASIEPDDTVRERQWCALAVDLRSFLADLSTDYSASDHVFTHVLLEQFTRRIDTMLELSRATDTTAPSGAT